MKPTEKKHIKEKIKSLESQLQELALLIAETTLSDTKDSPQSDNDALYKLFGLLAEELEQLTQKPLYEDFMILDAKRILKEEKIKSKTKVDIFHEWLEG